MRNLIVVPAAIAATLALTTPVFAQQYGYVPYGYAPMYGYAPPGAYGYGPSRQRSLDEGRYTASDLGPGVFDFGGARPDPMVGNNISRGTDNKGTVDPPTRDRDVVDAFKKID